MPTQSRGHGTRKLSMDKALGFMGWRRVMTFTESDQAACRKLVDLALAEDLGDGEDITSQAVVPAEIAGKAAFVAREEGVVAGLAAADMVCKVVDHQLTFAKLVDDGTPTTRGQRLATVMGPMRSLLIAERTALNFMQRLSGVATQTARFVAAVVGLPAKILDTRKTTPGWRLLEKYAVRAGGGYNHRQGLYDAVLIKDNHLAATAAHFDIAVAVRKSQAYTKRMVTIEVEVESLEQLLKVLPTMPNIVLLDNMTLDQMRTAVELRNKLAHGVQLEASGGVNLATVRAIAETGVDLISVGAITHSAPTLDIALDYLA
jgi:nicotinate-nucleotide pyrophosphorylase (carboxylating)